MTLNENERKVLSWLWDNAGLDYCFAFSPVANGTGLSIEATRIACRSLADMGLLKFYKGLVDDDGRMAGSGYGCLPRASDIVELPSSTSPQGAEK